MIQFDSQCKTFNSYISDRFLLSVLFSPLVSVICLSVKSVIGTSLIRTKGGVVNIHVVRATAKALIESNPVGGSHLAKFKMPRSLGTFYLQTNGIQSPNWHHNSATCSPRVI